MRAPKICSQEGCSTLTYDDASRCPEHHRRNGKWGPKVGTNRTATTAHKARRLRILRRDPMCQLGYAGCTGTSTICDHVIPLAAGGPDTDSNCQGVCRSCSDKKTSKEGHYLAGHNVERPWPTEGDSPEGAAKTAPSQRGRSSDETEPRPSPRQALPRCILPGPLS